MSARTSKSIDLSVTALGKWCLLVAVLIVQVRVPIPVVHDHDAVESPVTLAAHLDLRHADDPQIDDGFHWHWVLPNQGDESSDDGDDTLPVPPTSTASKVLASSDSSALGMLKISPSEWHTDQFFAFVEDSLPISQRSAAELSPLSSADRSCAVLCVIRC